MSKNNKKILLYKNENNFYLSEQIDGEIKKKSFIKTKDIDENILIKNREKIKKSIRTKKKLL